jgi:hypothetical protein
MSPSRRVQSFIRIRFELAKDGGMDIATFITQRQPLSWSPRVQSNVGLFALNLFLAADSHWDARISLHEGELWHRISST